MSRYYDYSNSVSWPNQSLQGPVPGIGGQKESSRGGGQSGLYQHAPHPAYTSTASQDSRVVMPITPRSSALYSQSMYHQYQAPKAPVPVMSNYPVLDVKFKRLPFYDVLGEILKPTSLIPVTPQRPQEASFSFYLTPQQATDVATGRDIVGISNKLEYIVQVQLRFCLAETTCEQEDFFPPNCGVKVNGKQCPLPTPIPTNKPGVEPKRPPRPVNITTFVKLCPTIPNTLTINWGTDFTRNYAFNVSLVRKLTSCQLLTRLKNKGTKHSDYTRSLIKDKLREDLDSEIATTSLRVSLVCPLGKMRMNCPCRPVTCSHLQCFDASLFLQMNERKPTWLCPVCDKPALYDTLVVDGYFQDVLNSSKLGSDCCEVQLHNDGSWSPNIVKKDGEVFTSPVKDTSKAKVEVISDDLEVIPLSDGSNSSARATPATSSPRTESGGASSETPRGADIVDLTSDSEDEVPMKRKVAKPADSTLSHNHQDSNVASTNNYNDTSANISSSTGVSSSGYQSPAPVSQSPVTSGAIISLDSPSPPPPSTSPLPAHQASVPRPRVLCNSQLLPPRY